MKKMTWTEVKTLLDDTAKAIEVVTPFLRDCGKIRLSRDLEFQELMLRRSIHRIEIDNWMDLAEEKKD